MTNIRNRLAQLEQSGLSTSRANVGEMSDAELLAYLQKSTTTDLSSLSDADLDEFLKSTLQAYRA